jgi:hypothetical protein
VPLALLLILLGVLPGLVLGFQRPAVDLVVAAIGGN